MSSSDPRPQISVVSPVYGAPDLVEPLVNRLENSLRDLVESFEVILVNDGCPHDSWSRIEQLAADRPWLVGVQLSRNFGQHYAITAGLDHALGEWVVVMDCDLQDQPEEIGKLYAKAQEGFDLVYGRRIERQDSFLKRAPGALFNKVFNYLSEQDSDRRIGNFSIARRPVVEAFSRYRERDRAYGQIMSKVGFRQTAVDIEHAARPEGRSSYSFGRLLAFSIQVMVSGSNKPLRLATSAGTWIAVASMIYAVWLIVRYQSSGVAVAGWTTLAVLIAFFSGLILMQLGLLGLYLGKTFNESKNRPLYHVRTVLNRSSES